MQRERREVALRRHDALYADPHPHAAFRPLSMPRRVQVARGSWPLVRGSWPLVRGSWPLVLSRVVARRVDQHGARPGPWPLALGVDQHGARPQPQALAGSSERVLAPGPCRQALAVTAGGLGRRLGAVAPLAAAGPIDVRLR